MLGAGTGITAGRAVGRGAAGTPSRRSRRSPIGGGSEPALHRDAGDRQRAAAAHRRDGDRELAARAVAAGGVLDEDRVDECPYVLGNGLGQRRRWFADLHHRDGHGALGAERPVPGQALVAHDAQRVDVARRPRLRAAGLLRGDVVGGAHHHPGPGDRHGVRGLRDPEVGELHLAVDADEDVAGLDVAVDVAAFVRGLQRPRGLLHDPQRLLGIQRAPGDQRRQRLAAHQLHHQVGRVPAAERARRPRRSRAPRRCRSGRATRRCGPRPGSGAGTPGRPTARGAAPSRRRCGPAGCPRPPTPRPSRRRRCAGRAGSGRRSGGRPRARSSPAPQPGGDHRAADGSGAGATGGLQ